MAHRSRRPKHKADVNAERRPKGVPSPQTGRIAISFVLFDDVKWCEKYDDGSQFPNVAKCIKHYESMKWQDIFSRDHRVKLSRLVPAAQKRLISLRLDDVDELWRFGMNSRKRLWGVRFNAIFYVLWWDPEHAVCPSTKKHT